MVGPIPEVTDNPPFVARFAPTSFGTKVDVGVPLATGVVPGARPTGIGGPAGVAEPAPVAEPAGAGPAVCAEPAAAARPTLVVPMAAVVGEGAAPKARAV